MDPRKLVLNRTALIALGTAVGTAVMIGVYALIGKLDASVLWGGFFGWLLATLNFFIMSFVLMLASEKAAENDVKGGSKLVSGSYLGRMVMLFGVAFLLAKSGLCSPIPLVLPLIFTRPTLTLYEFFNKSGDEKA